ncbi:MULTISPECIES: ABC transporter ATP-binding protein [unclassified Streptomyces]|uniref:ABC transporter ATP-binding protein n=1 Tax=Streptomyces TaxID=1883 RepID=UPI0001C189C6|nr:MULTISPECIES: ABC transporter ATP-binding protein [unclassified Streptomyces]AEN12570.1 ABC transporter related protein [Streptomyces sp. SirexAA-E]MYR69956.1 ATP-binding cassette domain-containing protein [Streptomyces sp. SID4939]MYS01966.1 ATP-binding cassette domain-containing protein [Streptomyces sp. SID4940]MYT62891.1 ATP-binding cassette domain-containing protein [Streptomyces sp. SID8357]MYT88833.1 ATP-binding cassette domain-containing protein [Streptomyces sp. SID8360]
MATPDDDKERRGPVVAEHTLQAQDVRLGYGDREIVTGLDVSIPPGQVTVIVGPNACGKSTLLRAMARLLPPTGGSVLLDGRSIQEMPTKEVAAVLGILPQSPSAPEGITVSDLVGRGRYPHQGWFRRWTAEDDEAVARALLSTDVLELADRPVDELSGGQRQRVWIAMALSQRTDILLLDEPTTFLDVSHQLDVLDLLTDLNRERGVTMVAVLHDLNLACRYADHMIAMKGGRIVAEGRPRDIVTEELVGEVFGMRCTVLDDPASATPMVVPLGRHHVKGAAA